MANIKRNRLLYANRIKEEVTKGLPDGLDESLLKNIPILFERIDELERALAPFARAVQPNATSGRELIEVYFKDCVNAMGMLDPNNAHPLPKKQLFYPAE